jgi:hypothetical protein
VIGQIKNGRVRAIAIASLKRFPALPDTPTIDESGLKGFEATTWFGVMAPLKTPRDIITRLNADLARIVASPEVRDRFIGEGNPLADKGYKTFPIPRTDEIACCSVPVPHMLRKMIIDADRGGAHVTLSMEMLRLLL